MIKVLVNPEAGKGRHRGSLPGVLSRIGGAGPVRVLDSRATPREILDDATAVVVFGGDGTVHLALQAVAGTGTACGIIPAGTGNDMAACFGLPAEPLAAADTVARALAGGGTRAVDLGRVTTRDGSRIWFGGVLAAGFDAIVNERANRMRRPRGPRRYDLAILLELARLRPRRYDLVFDGVAKSLDAVLLAVGNIASYGGGMRICPDADPADGLLDVLWADPISRATLIRVKPRIYAGTHVRHPAVHQRRVREISIDTPGIVCYADGERVAPLPVTVAVEPGALALLG